ncbi:11011_t:CDS:1, partial [Funneliformis geosporum]
LANFTKNLGDNHSITTQHFKDFSPEQISLVCHKRACSYEYIDSHNRFLETELLTIHEFHGQLSRKIT